MGKGKSKPLGVWLLGFVLLALPARADPALWAARGPHVTIDLLGSINALRPGQTWLTGTIKDAFDASSTCWFEVDQTGMQPQAVEAALRVGLDPAHKLSNLLTPAERTRLVATVKRVKMPGGLAAIDPMRPWLAAAMLAAADVANSGYSSEDGVDAVLLKHAQTANRPVHGLETAPDQLKGLSSMPPAIGLRMLRNVLKGGDSARTTADRVAKAWINGDLAALAAQTNSDDPATDDALATAVFKTCNAAWANRIMTLVAGNESAFVTVGAGHLVGPGNLHELLEARGIHLNRIMP